MPDKYFNKKRETAYAKGGGRPIYTYNPLDFEDETAIGVMLPFNGTSAALDVALGRHDHTTAELSKSNKSLKKLIGKFPLSYTTEEQALSNLKNLLLTYPGERYMQPTFGVRIKDRVFEQNTPELVVGLNREIQDAVNTWLPYIKINSIKINNEDEYNNITNYLFIILKFRVTEQGASQEMTLVSNGEQTTTIETAVVY
jgi:phage baseplate assembly protein W